MSCTQAFSSNSQIEQSGVEDLAFLCIETGLGNTVAESKLIRILMPEMKRFLMSASWDKGNVDDVLQEALIIVLKKLRNAELNNLERVRAFAIGIARNVLIGTARKNAKIVSGLSGFTENVVDSAVGPLDNLISIQQNDDVVRAIGRLGQGRDRDIIFGYYYQGQSARQLCDLFKVSSIHFHRVLHRARTRLVAALQCH